jgi:hypothetical protein
MLEWTNKANSMTWTATVSCLPYIHYSRHSTILFFGHTVRCEQGAARSRMEEWLLVFVFEKQQVGPIDPNQFKKPAYCP